MHDEYLTVYQAKFYQLTNLMFATTFWKLWNTVRMEHQKRNKEKDQYKECDPNVMARDYYHRAQQNIARTSEQ